MNSEQATERFKSMANDRTYAMNAQEYKERQTIDKFTQGLTRVEQKRLEAVCQEDIKVLEEKGKTYGDSWKKRGGVGAFMMLARKWDRIENQCQARGYDIFHCDITEKDGLLDDISDLRRYLLLVEAELLSGKLTPEKEGTPFRAELRFDHETRHIEGLIPAAEEPGRGYVHQD